MAKVRSPNYPSMDLGAALKAVRLVFEKDNRNKVSRMTLAKHLGHDSLSGPALGKIGAIRAYGLVEGAGDEMRVSDDAVTALMAPLGSPERQVALERLAFRPPLFQEIRKEFTSAPSTDNLRYWLVKKQYATDGAEKASKAYLGTLRLVNEGGASYVSSEDGKQDPPMHKPNQDFSGLGPPPSPGMRNEFDDPDPPAPPGTRKSVFALTEGDAVLILPEELSRESIDDLRDYIDIYFKKLRREAGEAN